MVTSGDVPTEAQLVTTTVTPEMFHVVVTGLESNVRRAAAIS